MQDKPLISKENFVLSIEFMESMNRKFDKLSEMMEDMSPGCYVNFWPHLAYNDQIMDLLSLLMKEPVGQFDANLIELFCYDWNYGSELPAKPVTVNGTVFAPTTAAELYDALVAINFTNNTSNTNKKEEDNNQ